MKRVVLLLAAVAVFSSAVPASASPIVVDAGWYGFCFAATVGSGAYDDDVCLNEAIDTAGNSFTFDALTPVLFKITDAFLYGDIFSVVIDGGPAFLTSPVAVGGGNPVDLDPNVAFADPKYSKFSVLLAPGAHSIDVFYSSGTGVGGGGYLEVETAQAVPDAGSAAALLGLGMIGLSTLRRKLAK